MSAALSICLPCVVLRACCEDASAAISSVRQHSRDSIRQPFPVARFLGELLSTALRQLIKLCLAVVLRVAPLGSDQALLLETVQRWIQRSLIDLEHRPGNRLNPE